MNSTNTNSSQRNATWRRLLPERLERPAPSPFSIQHSAFSISAQGFTILEMMIVVGIIGLMAAMALPHLRGFGSGNAMTAATRQLLDDVGLARQRAMANRSQVCMVFLPPDFWTNNGTLNQQVFTNLQSSNLLSHQYASYALISMRTVGDQPGISNIHYLTDWRVLPKGIFISPFLLTNSNWKPLTPTVTNTTTGLTNGFTVQTFVCANFPFPSTYSGISNLLPYIAFSPSGQIANTNGDVFILLGSGSIFYPANTNGGLQFLQPDWIETPSGNTTNNPNIIHIDYVTGRAKLERNQF